MEQTMVEKFKLFRIFGESTNKNCSWWMKPFQMLIWYSTKKLSNDCPWLQVLQLPITQFTKITVFPVLSQLGTICQKIWKNINFSLAPRSSWNTFLSQFVKRFFVAHFSFGNVCLNSQTWCNFLAIIVVKNPEVAQIQYSHVEQETMLQRINNKKNSIGNEHSSEL